MTDHDNNPTVTCACCAEEFEGFAPTQASGCAADIHDTGIVGHYGSAVADMCHFRFKAGQPPESLPIGAQICDPCIDKLLADGILDDKPDNRSPWE